MTEPVHRPHLLADVTLRSTGEGGRRGGIGSGYRPNAILTGAPEPPPQQGADLRGCQLHLEVETLEPGGTARARVYPFDPEAWVALRPGALAGLYEGLRLVGSLHVVAPLGRAFVEEVAGFAAREAASLAARGVAVRAGRSPDDRSKSAAWVTLERLPHATADLTVWDSGEAEIEAGWGQTPDGCAQVVQEHRAVTSVEEVWQALQALIELVAANPRNHGLPGDFVPRSNDEARYLAGVLGRVPDLDVWPREDEAGSWLLLSFDLVAGGAIRDVVRVDFDGLSINGGWSPAYLNGDSELRAHAAGLGPAAPDWVAAIGSPEELASATVRWFAGVIERWPHERGAPWLHTR